MKCHFCKCDKQVKNVNLCKDCYNHLSETICSLCKRKMLENFLFNDKPIRIPGTTICFECYFGLSKINKDRFNSGLKIKLDKKVKNVKS